LGNKLTLGNSKAARCHGRMAHGIDLALDERYALLSITMVGREVDAHNTTVGIGGVASLNIIG
jgi:hypothetical protein